ncbi:DNA-binding transcriptional ArsR family regulator [Nocardia sp. GAS34]|uniref:ArsR/SmtB family transcription factor n=1 Tax=unclassified Nocardia TaxID=2637762 RepID=UPI003D1CCEE8
MTADSGTPTHDAGTPARRSRVAVEAPAPIPHDPYPYRAPAAPAVPSRPVLDNAGELLRALAAPVRIAIVLQLRESPRCVHELVDTLGVTQPLVSQHLRILKSAGVVRGERTGREVIYELVDDHLARIVVDAVAHAEEG